MIPPVPDPLPPDLCAVLADVAAGRATPAGGLARLIILATGARELDAAVAAARSSDAPALQRLATLHDERPQAAATIRSVLATVDHTPTGDPATRLAAFASMFDRAAAVSPEASVALHSLGDPALLADSTAEVVGYLASTGLVDVGRLVMEVGCGFGRIAGPLTAAGCRYAGIDVSPRMIDIARQRNAALTGAAFAVAPAHDPPVADGVVDLVLCVDAFPYVVAAGGDLAARSLAAFARALRPGGDLVILNHSYRDDLPADVADLTAAARRLGLDPVALGDRPFVTWDGALFHLRRPRC